MMIFNAINTEQEKHISLKDVVLESFWDFWREFRKSTNYTFYVLKGGRNSAKSTTTAQALLMDLIENPISIVVYRKVGRTIEESVYEQLKEAAIQLGIEDEFIYYKSPHKIVYKERGNAIVFRGADDVQKSKSIKISKYPIAICWFEEVTEFKTEDEWDIIVDSILREELKEFRYKIVVSYNPPKRKNHWVNKKWESKLTPSDTYIHHSDYRANKYLSKQTINKIEHTKKTNLQKYKWMYLGEATGGGVVPFQNLTFRPITDEEVKEFDNIRQGIDWGYATDPVSFGRMHYDKTRRKLYIFDEYYGVKISNRKLADWIKTKEYENDISTADSAEPKSIAEMRSYNVMIRRAKKGQGSVEYGEKWLDDLEEIIIDPNRCPNTAKEWDEIDYQVDKDGELLPKLEDKNNHSIDMTRYAMEKDMKFSELAVA